MTRMQFFPGRSARLLVGSAFGAFLSIVLGAPGFAALTGESPWVDQTNSKVRLISGAVAQDASGPPYAGVQLRMDSGWKTYWRNPGDSGVPPAFDWAGSKNLKSAEVLYPAPHRFDDAGGSAIGYDGQVVFPVKITPEDAGKPVELSLTFSYGLCKDLCIPNEVELTASLPPDLGKGDAALLGAALADVPKPEEPEALPRIASITPKLDDAKPRLEVEALFPDGASGTDLFVSNPELPMPVPKALGPLADGKQRFAVTFLLPSEVEAIKGKPLTLTLVSDQGSSETTWTAN